jgi:hypothetical protein
MDALLPVIDLVPELRLRSKIPLSPKEEIGDSTELVVKVNIGTAYLNHGRLKKAEKTYSEVLSLQHDRTTAMKGLITTKAFDVKDWEDESATIQFFEQGVAMILSKTDEVMAGNDLKARVRIFGSLWALCHGNGENAETVSASEGFFEHWITALDRCLEDELPLEALMCLGVGSTVFVNSLQGRVKLLRAGGPDRIIGLLEKYCKDPKINLQCLSMLGGLSKDDSDPKEHAKVSAAVAVAVKNWGKFHSADLDVCYTALEQLPTFLSYCSKNLVLRNVEGLVKLCLKTHANVPALQLLGERFLGVVKANATVRRGSSHSAISLPRPTNEGKKVLIVLAMFRLFCYNFSIATALCQIKTPYSTQVRNLRRATAFNNEVLVCGKNGMHDDKVHSRYFPFFPFSFQHACLTLSLNPSRQHPPNYHPSLPPYLPTYPTVCSRRVFVVAGE